MSETPDTGAEAPQSAAAKLFDLRVLIGGLFLVYGVMLTVAGRGWRHALMPIKPAGA